VAATIEIRSFHGASGSPTPTNIKDTEIRHKLADNDTADLNSPIPIPSSGTKYGWRKHTKLFVVSGLGTQIGNIRWFAAASPSDWAGTVSMFAGLKSSYTQGGSGDESAQVSGTANASLYDSTNPLTVNAATNAITANSSYGTQDYVVQQIGVNSTATSGVKTARTCSYRYDEI